MSTLVDTDLERRVLGHAILSPEWLTEGGLRDEMFTLGAHRTALAAMRRVLSAGDRLDTLALRGAILADQGRVDDVWLLALTEDISYKPAEDAQRLQELAYLRAVGDHAKRLQGASEAGSRSAIAKCITDLAAITDRDPEAVTEYTAGDLMDAVDSLTEESSSKRIRPGCEVVHRLVGDLVPGHMLVIGADTNVGKSSLVQRMAVGMDSAGERVAVISCEDGASLFGLRLIAERSGVSARLMLSGQCDERQQARVERAKAYWRTRGLMFDHLQDATESEVCMAMSRRVRQGARVVLVDYVQAIDASDRQQDRRNEMRVVSKRIKATAQRLDVPLVLASQLSRPKEKLNRKPTKHDLKEAGDIENAAESILLMWRNEEQDGAPVNIWCAKGKMGGVGTEDSFVRETSGVLRSQAEALKGRPFE